tara:strand:+ start:8860 stop:9246 length:387 start_codon:yes stop_codon:yes gene_type:complete
MDLKKTVRILMKPRSGADGSDRNVWSGPIESGEFELVSTMMLQNILEADDGSAKEQLKQVAEFDIEGTGLLAHNATNDSYEIVDGEGNEEFSLVTTQMLQRILKKDESGDPGIETLEVDSGFDPYNSD